MANTKKARGRTFIQVTKEARDRLNAYAKSRALTSWRVANHAVNRFLDQELGCRFLGEASGVEGTLHTCSLLREEVDCGGNLKKCRHDRFRSGELMV